MSRATASAFVPHAARYVLAGGFTTLLYMALTLILSGPAGLPIQGAMAIAFATVLASHFLLQRYFVFRHVQDFKLSAGGQARRYLLVSLTQYSITALLLAVLPERLDLSEQLVYLGVTPVVVVLTFLTLRARVFHGHGPSAPPLNPRIR